MLNHTVTCIYIYFALILLSCAGSEVKVGIEKGLKQSGMKAVMTGELPKFVDNKNRKRELSSPASVYPKSERNNRNDFYIPFKHYSRNINNQVSRGIRNNKQRKGVRINKQGQGNPKKINRARNGMRERPNTNYIYPDYRLMLNELNSYLSQLQENGDFELVLYNGQMDMGNRGKNIGGRITGGMGNIESIERVDTLPYGVVEPDVYQKRAFFDTDFIEVSTGEFIRRVVTGSGYIKPTTENYIDHDRKEDNSGDSTYFDMDDNTLALTDNTTDLTTKDTRISTLETTSTNGLSVNIENIAMIVSGSIGFIILFTIAFCCIRSNRRKQKTGKANGIKVGQEIIFSIGDLQKDNNNTPKRSQKEIPSVEINLKSRSLPTLPKQVPLLPGQIKMIQDDHELYDSIDEIRIEETLE